MVIPLDRGSNTPLYRQIEAWLRKAIDNQLLAPGTRLPAARALAMNLGLSRTTVDAAYAELLSEGLLETRGSGGTLVARVSRRLRSAGLPAPTSGHPNHGEARSGTLDFSGGGGDDSLFPFPAFLRGLKTRHREAPSELFGFPDPAGEWSLRTSIAHICASQGLLLLPEEILITGGSQQVLALTACTLAHDGDAVLVEEPTYAKAIALFRALGLKVVGLPCDAQGPIPEDFQRLAEAHHPRFAYLIPNFRNPTGSCMGASRRRRLVALAEALDLPILEDDYVGGLRYEGQPLPALKTLARPGQVIYTSTFSKLLAPSLCAGFLAAEGPLLERLRTMKSLLGFSSSRVFQCGLADFVGVGSYRNHIRRATRLFRQRRDVMCEALTRHLPAIRFARPAGGLFLWLELPVALEGPSLAEACAGEGVRVACGSECFAEPQAPAERYLRLNFASMPAEAIPTGIERLARALRSLAPSLGSKATAGIRPA